MSARALLKAFLVRTLTRALRYQGIYDVEVLDLSDDFEVAKVMRKGRTALVRCEILLAI